jgi:hypothetical protein
MVSHPKLPLEELGDALARPAIPAEAESLSPPAEQRHGLGLLDRRETRRAAGSRPLLERGLPRLAGPRQPLADGAFAHPQRGGNLSLSPALSEQLPGA